MTTTNQTNAPGDQFTGHGIELQDGERHTHRSSFRETKPALKATELWIYLAAVVGVLSASYLVGEDEASGDGDYFAADKAWLYIVILTVGYLVARGLAKSGSRTDIDD